MYSVCDKRYLPLFVKDNIGLKSGFCDYQNIHNSMILNFLPFSLCVSYVLFLSFLVNLTVIFSYENLIQ